MRPASGDWSDIKNLLCIRADNLGDVIMTSPALRALKETFGCTISLLTSQSASLIAKHIPAISEVIAYDLPWVKQHDTVPGSKVDELIANLKERRFDAVVIFTVYSQSPLLAALICYMAGIGRCLAYCRENPYELVSNWVPDSEPLTMIKHQVRRDLDLVAFVGAHTHNEDIQLSLDDGACREANEVAGRHQIDLTLPYILIHPGVSEVKREYLAEHWKELLILLTASLSIPLVVTGNTGEKPLTQYLSSVNSDHIKDLGGELSLPGFMDIIAGAALVITVNTATSHIATAFKVPQIVLYAQTNPQHTPWRSPAIVLELPVHDTLKSRNELIRFVDRLVYKGHCPVPLPAQVELLVLDFFAGCLAFPPWKELALAVPQLPEEPARA